MIQLLLAKEACLSRQNNVSAPSICSHLQDNNNKLELHNTLLRTEHPITVLRWQNDGVSETLTNKYVQINQPTTKPTQI